MLDATAFRRVNDLGSPGGIMRRWVIPEECPAGYYRLD
jgi:hypothetical protein